MKYIKKYENLDTNPPNFKVGDTVICVKPKGSLIKGKRYVITKIIQDNGYYYCFVKDSRSDYYCGRFISELEYNSNKYNL